jgi:hypothetical protein
MANAFKTHRVAFANFVPTAAATYTSGVIIPKDAILKSVTSVEGTALAGGTNVTFSVGAQDITAAIALASFTGVDTHDLTDTDGLAVTASGDFSITTTGTFSAGDIDVYVEYYFAEDHT